MLSEIRLLTYKTQKKLPSPNLQISLQTIDDGLANINKIQLQVLRLDEVHPIISGNKLFKLHEYLQALEQADGNKKIVTFGGAYSNHLVATAYACKNRHIPCTGIVRGEAAAHLSHTLQHCINYGMQLQFVSREEYARKDTPGFLEALAKQYPGAIIIPEGGYSKEGAAGASLINQYIPEAVTHVCCAAGTATTAAGLLLQSPPGRQVLVIPVLKGMSDLTQRLHFLTGQHFAPEQLQVNHDYHFGGYAKRTPELIQFMNQLYEQYQLPTDFVYTAKLVYGVMDLVKKNYFPPASRVLCIHSGGLQGNLSLPAGTLTF